MNHLAHLLLAGDDPDEIAGALMGDFVRGRVRDQFAPAMRLGVLVHRKIDSFTDSHPTPRLSRRRIRSPLRRYAGLVIDLAYDHYLSRHWARFSAESFDAFSSRIYAALNSRRSQMPARLSERLPLMIDDDFLRRGFLIEDVAHALNRLQQRLSRAPDLSPAIDDIRAADAEVEADFLRFFPELRIHVAQQRRDLSLGPNGH